MDTRKKEKTEEMIRKKESEGHLSMAVVLGQ